MWLDPHAFANHLYACRSLRGSHARWRFRTGRIALLAAPPPVGLSLLDLDLLTCDSMDMAPTTGSSGCLHPRGFLQIADSLLEPTLPPAPAPKGKPKRNLGPSLVPFELTHSPRRTAARGSDKGSHRVGQYRQRIELDCSPDLLNGLSLSFCGQQVGRVVQTGHRQAGIELDGAL